MNQQEYVKKNILKFIQLDKKNKYWHSYNLIRIKRFLIQTFMLFIFQYITIMELSFSYPALPMYPPIGIAFTMFYLLGPNSIPGLLLGGFLAYFFKGLDLTSIFLYSLADIGSGYLGAIVCSNILSSDIRPFANPKETLKFISISAIISLLSSSIRMIAAISHNTNTVDFGILLYNYLDLFLSDLNAILAISTFLLSWIYAPFSREKISNIAIKKSFITSLLCFIIIAITFMHKISIISLIIIAMLASLYFAYIYGYLIATLLLFIDAVIYLSYFVNHKQHYILSFGSQIYTLAPIYLLLFSICMIQLGHMRYSLKNNRS